MFHVWQMLASVLPEGKRAVQEVAKFIRNGVKPISLIERDLSLQE